MTGGPRALGRWRKQLGWTQQQVADRVGVSQNAVWCWENGRKSPQTRYALALHEISHGAVPIVSWVDRRASR